MPNTAHILETAVLILVAFLVGCVVGYLARRLVQRRSVAKTVAVVAPAEATISGPPLVTAPDIAPLPGTRRRTAAERLAAAAGRSPVEEPASAGLDQTAEQPAPAPVVAQPTPATSESVIILPPPSPVPETPPVLVVAVEPSGEAVAPAVVAETPSGEDVAAQDAEPAVHEPQADSTVAEAAASRTDSSVATDTAFLPADEVAAASQEQDTEPAAAAPAPSSDAAAAAAIESTPLPIAPQAEVKSAPATRTALEDPESAAMRAIEGNWTPRRRAPQNPIPHPDQAPAREVDDAMQTARSAVAAAAAAAAAAIAEAQERPRRPPADEGLRFEQRSEALAKSFLEGEDELPAAPASGLSFEPEHPTVHQGFGRPEALAEPREGNPDNLKQIKGITPALEASLHGLGIFHFDQIADWDRKAIVWIEHHLSLHGRVARDKWLEQAEELAAGRTQTLRPVRR